MFGNQEKRLEEVDVLVVGAGPTGCLHALWFAQQGKSVMLIDRRERGESRDEWMMLEPEALEVLSAVGVTAEANGGTLPGNRVSELSIEIDGTSPTELALGRLGITYQHLVICRRGDLTAALEQRLEAEEVPVFWNHELRTLDVSADSCRAIVEKAPPHDSYLLPGGPLTEDSGELVARWVVGADGRRSVVRRELQASFEALTEPQVNVIVEFEGDPDSSDTARIVVGEADSHSFWSTGEGRQLWISQPDADAIPGIDIDCHLGLSVDSIQRGVVDDRYIVEASRKLGMVVDRVLWRHAIRYQPHRAKPMGKGPAWVSGAAAQVVAPAVGADENLGLREARDLALLFGIGTNGAPFAPFLTSDAYAQRRSALLDQALGRDGGARILSEAIHCSEGQAERVLRHLPLFGRSRDDLLAQLASPPAAKVRVEALR